MTAKDFPQELLDLYDGYAHGQLSRRGFLDQAQRFAVGSMTAAVILAALSPDYALAQQVKPDDPAIVGERITFDSPRGNGSVMGYLVRPAGAASRK